MRCLVIYNPAAGKKGAYRGVREQIRHYCQKEGIDLEEAVTQFPGHAEKIAEAAARTGEPVKIYGVGGDGTLCEIAGAAAGRNHVLVGNFPWDPVMIISEPLALKSAFCRWRRR